MARTMMDDLLAGLPDGPVLEVRVGAFWTAVVTAVGGERRCGLASNLREVAHRQGKGPTVPAAGRLTERSSRELAELCRSESIVEAGIGLAAINASLPRLERLWVEENAESAIITHGKGKRVALVGHFPFVERVREQVPLLSVLELHPHAGDLPAEAAEAVLPRADAVAITGTTLLNHTFEHLIALPRPTAMVMVLGPTTPLSPVMFDHGVDAVFGAVVEDIDAVLLAVSQGANFQQIHRCGVRLVTMNRSS